MARQLSSAALAAKAIRKELKEKFPGVKFSVRSSNFSMGNSVDIAYNTVLHGFDGDGKAPANEVWKVANKYQYGHFDGMTDSYEYSNCHDDLPASKIRPCFSQVEQVIMSDIVSIDRVRRVWDVMGNEYSTATSKFNAAKEEAAQAHVGCEAVTAGEFFQYLKEIKQERAMYNRNRRHAIDPNGDFDDMGNAHIERQYRYGQKKLRGRL